MFHGCPTLLSRSSGVPLTCHVPMVSHSPVMFQWCPTLLSCSSGVLVSCYVIMVSPESIINFKRASQTPESILNLQRVSSIFREHHQSPESIINLQRASSISRKCYQSSSKPDKSQVSFHCLLIFIIHPSPDSLKLRQYQVGNKSSRKITAVKQLVPWLALGWVTTQVWSGCCSEKYSKISRVEKRGLQ